MDEQAGQSPDDADKHDDNQVSSSDATPSSGEADAGNHGADHAANHVAKLPVVWSPKLDASEAAAESATTATEAPQDQASATAAPADDLAMPRALRFALLAASLAAAAALGALGGSLSAGNVAHLLGGAKTSSAMASNTATPHGDAADVATLKANLEAALRNANAQFAKMTERLDRLDRAQIEPGVRLARLADAVDRLEKKMAAAPSPTAAAASSEATGSIAAAPPSSEVKPQDKILRDWVVQDVRAGHALVESRYGGLFAVTSGSILPGLGRVESIKKQDGYWVVVTGRGLISSAP